MKKKGSKKYGQTVSSDLEKEQIVGSLSSIFDINQYLKYENDMQQPLFDHAFSMRYTIGFFLLNKYNSTKNHPWGGKGGVILKLQSDINIPDGNNSLIIHGIMKEVL